jgi:uncharacterized protein YkwD
MFAGCAQLARVNSSATTSAGSASPLEQQMVGLINGFRNRHGLRSLNIHSNLQSKAHSVAQNMVSGVCGWSGGLPMICHSNLTAGIRVTWGFLGENVGMVPGQNDVNAMEGAFENSPPHRETMLNGQINFVGVGIAHYGNYMYVAEEFMAA